MPRLAKSAKRSAPLGGPALADANKVRAAGESAHANRPCVLHVTKGLSGTVGWLTGYMVTHPTQGANGAGPASGQSGAPRYNTPGKVLTTSKGAQVRCLPFPPRGGLCNSALGPHRREGSVRGAWEKATQDGAWEGAVPPQTAGTVGAHAEDVAGSAEADTCNSGLLLFACLLVQRLPVEAFMWR